MAVQLVGGRELLITAGNPLDWLERFAVAGEVAVVDLDAACGSGDNCAIVEKLCAAGTCRVGGGIRDFAAARRWLDAGAARIVLGTAAEPALLRRLPRERVIVALDAVNGEVVVDGWRRFTGLRIAERIAELRGLAGGFLVTFVEREGRLGGTDMARARAVIGAAGDARVTIAGGITTAEQVAELDRMGADAQVGMALYTGTLTLGRAMAAIPVSDRADGLIPTVVVDERGTALGLAWSSRDSLARAVDERRGIYQSRRRGMWTKGELSGATQRLLRVDLDCDRDALRFTVRQEGAGFCHSGSATCWGCAPALAALERTVRGRASLPDKGSYSRRLLDDPSLLAEKLVEEATELAAATGPGAVVDEAADVLYFTLVKLAASGVTLEQVERELARRALRITRRRGDSKRANARAAT